MKINYLWAMENNGAMILTIGILFLVGLIADTIGTKTHFPRVTLLVLFGVFIGPSFLDLIPPMIQDLYPIFTDIALGMVGFLIGGKITADTMRNHGKEVFVISFLVVVFTVAAVLFGLYAIGVSLGAALVLSAIACATDPASVMDVVREMRAKGDFSKTLVGIVAVDDAWGLIVFSIFLVLAQAAMGVNTETQFIFNAVWELFGAIFLGALIGFPAAYFTGRISEGEPTMTEAIGVVFITCGAALWMEFSFLLACMIVGGIVANFAFHHKRPFHAIENIEWPFMILFFILSGATLLVHELLEVWWICAAYFFLRILGRIVGGWVGGKASGADSTLTNWIGIALLPQAGIALGTALLATQTLPELEKQILPVAVGTIVAFELIGPLFTRMALKATGEAHR